MSDFYGLWIAMLDANCKQGSIYGGSYAIDHALQKGMNESFVVAEIILWNIILMPMYMISNEIA